MRKTNLFLALAGSAAAGAASVIADAKIRRLLREYETVHRVLIPDVVRAVGSYAKLAEIMAEQGGTARPATDTDPGTDGYPSGYEALSQLPRYRELSRFHQRLSRDGLHIEIFPTHGLRHLRVVICLATGDAKRLRRIASFLKSAQVFDIWDIQLPREPGAALHLTITALQEALACRLPRELYDVP